MGKMATALNRHLMSRSLKGTTLKGDANSEVTSYTLSAEELEKYRAMPAQTISKPKGSNSKMW